MQLFNGKPRDKLTSTQVISLIRDSHALQISDVGCELLDQKLTLLEDISTDLLTGSVTRQSYATLHGTCELQLSRELAWGRAVVRPYITLQSDAVSARFNLGAYFTNTPNRVLGTEPITYSVDCYDILHALDTPTGQSYSVGKGKLYLTAIRTILLAQGYTKFIIDQNRAGTTLPSARVWPLDVNTTWLNVVNDLLAAIGYRGIWSDWDGYLRCEPYVVPSDRQSEWTYDTNVTTSMIGPTRDVTRDYYDTPNKWVGIRSNNIDANTPVEGDGIYTYINQYDGETSVEGRNGRVITRILSVEAADQDALISRVKEAVESDTTVKSKITVPISPNPLHWHFDKILMSDPDYGVDTAMLVTRWTLNLDGSDMTQEWSEI